MTRSVSSHHRSLRRLRIVTTIACGSNGKVGATHPRPRRRTWHVGQASTTVDIVNRFDPRFFHGTFTRKDIAKVNVTKETSTSLRLHVSPSHIPLSLVRLFPVQQFLVQQFRALLFPVQQFLVRLFLALLFLVVRRLVVSNADTGPSCFAIQ